jgi:tetratricopeptide (TPR) repeat protein
MREARAFMNHGDFESALRLLGLMERGGVRVASLKGEMAAAMLDRKLTLDTAARFIDEGIAAVRKDFAQQGAAKGSAGRGAAGNSMLAGWLYLSGRLLVMQEKPEQAVALLNESIQLAETEATALDLGKAYERLNRIDEAVKMLLVACSFDGARKQEAREALARIYGDRETVRPLEAEIREAVEKRKATRPPGSSYVQKGLALKGKPAPPFELASASGQKVNLSDYQGRVMLLNFWATW